jgi:hypothetical protein
VTVEINFERRLIHGHFRSKLIFAQCVLGSMRLSSLAYGVVCIKKRLVYITNNVFTSRYEYRIDIFALDLDRPRHLANC